MTSLPLLQRRYAPQRGQRSTITALPLSRRHYLRNAAIVVAAVILIVWTVFPFVWILMTSLKNSADIISAPPKFIFRPTMDNYAALFFASHQGEYSTSRPDFPLFFVNSVIISTGAVALSVLASLERLCGIGGHRTAPIVRPRTIYFCTIRLSSNCGRAETMVAAAICPHSTCS